MKWYLGTIYIYSINNTKQFILLSERWIEITMFFNFFLFIIYVRTR